MTNEVGPEHIRRQARRVAAHVERARKAAQGREYTKIGKVVGLHAGPPVTCDVEVPADDGTVFVHDHLRYPGWMDLQHDDIVNMTFTANGAWVENGHDVAVKTGQSDGTILASVYQALDDDPSVNINAWENWPITVIVPDVRGIVTVQARLSGGPDDVSATDSFKTARCRIQISLDDGVTYFDGPPSFAASVNGGGAMPLRRTGGFAAAYRLRGTATNDIRIRPQHIHVAGGSGGQVSFEGGALTGEIIRGIV